LVASIDDRSDIDKSESPPWQQPGRRASAAAASPLIRAGCLPLASVGALVAESTAVDPRHRCDDAEPTSRGRAAAPPADSAPMAGTPVSRPNCQQQHRLCYWDRPRRAAFERRGPASLRRTAAATADADVNAKSASRRRCRRRVRGIDPRRAPSRTQSGSVLRARRWGAEPSGASLGSGYSWRYRCSRSGWIRLVSRISVLADGGSRIRRVSNAPAYVGRLDSVAGGGSWQCTIGGWGSPFARIIPRREASLLRSDWHPPNGTQKRE
jgi:hypothetical protein